MKIAFSSIVFFATTGISLAQCLPQSDIKSPSPNPGLSDRTGRPFPVSPSYVREADVMWCKRTWRVIDLREKINHPLYYPSEPTTSLMSLFDVFKCAVLEHDVVAFANPIFDDEFRTPMNKSEVQGMLVQWDSAHQSEDPNNPGTFLNTPLKKEITSANVRQYWIKEDWFFDKERSVMEVRIIGICPLVEKVAENGDVVGVKPLFWLYFPELRPYLVKAASFNFHNDGERMSFDEVFVKRKFSSYVYKESNVYNRSIADYKRGVDALLESDDIKEGIFKYESDLWHY